MAFEPETIDRLNATFETLKQCLPLGHWKVNLYYSTADEMEDLSGSTTAYGVTKIKEHMEFANIYLNVDAIYQDWDTPTHTLIHEFVHVLHFPLHSYVESTYDTKDYFEQLHEQFINHMSCAIYNLLELK